jgi:lipid-binding SYLF domain-containing protein
MRTVHQLTIATLLFGALAVAGCSNSSNEASGTDVGSGTTASAGASTSAGQSSRAAQLDQRVDQALADLYQRVPGSADLARKAKGILVFPSVVKGGAGIGGEFGRGALRVNDVTVGYYQTLSGSFGFQLGGQSRSMVFMFMTDDALRNFENSSGWQVGANAGVTLVTTGANIGVSSKTAQQPILAFVYCNTGLMYDASLQGTKVTRIAL